MTNAERLVLLRHALQDILRVRDELELAMLDCPSCSHRFSLDASGEKFAKELDLLTGTLSVRINSLVLCKPRSQRVSREA